MHRHSAYICNTSSLKEKLWKPRGYKILQDFFSINIHKHREVFTKHIYLNTKETVIPWITFTDY